MDAFENYSLEKCWRDYFLHKTVYMPNPNPLSDELGIEEVTKEIISLAKEQSVLPKSYELGELSEKMLKYDKVAPALYDAFMDSEDYDYKEPPQWFRGSFYAGIGVVYLWNKYLLKFNYKKLVEELTESRYDMQVYVEELVFGEDEDDAKTERAKGNIERKIRPLIDLYIRKNLVGKFFSDETMLYRFYLRSMMAMYVFGVIYAETKLMKKYPVKIELKKVAEEGDFCVVKSDNRYGVFCGEKMLKTPKGKTARTLYLPIAKRMMKDWKDLGYESYNSPTSILNYHFYVTDELPGYAEHSKEIIDFVNGLQWYNRDWTLQPCRVGNPEIMMHWMNMFGCGEERVKKIAAWICYATNMQLAAMICVYKYFQSMNIAYLMAIVVEHVPRVNHRKAIRDIFNFYSNFDQSCSYTEFWKIFDCFRLYYGIHFKEEGQHLPD